MKKKIVAEWLVFIVSISLPVNALAIDAPTLGVSTSGLKVSATWSPVSSATGYTLYYAPFPYKGEQTIESKDMSTNTDYSVTLWEGAAYYVAITASDGSTESIYSNIEQFSLTDPIVCTADYSPVCGADGNTYSNSCNADVAGVAVQYEGECTTTTCAAPLAVTECTIAEQEVNFKVSDSSQTLCYNDMGAAITCPLSGNFYGQDAQYSTLTPSYDVCNGVVVDTNTGLMWEQAHHKERISYSEASTYCSDLDLGGYSDWRIPSIRELFSINQANGNQNEECSWYLDGTVFELDYPESVELTGSHTTSMMGQTWSSTSRPDNTAINYFYNFFDGHIKSNFNNSANATLFYRCARGDAETFATTNYTDNGDTVTDNNTGIMWQQANGEQTSGDYQFTWQEAMAYCEDLNLADYNDWKLPDINELQSIVNYEITPKEYNETHKMIDPVFTFTLPAGKNLTENPTTSPPNGNSIAPFFWSSTTHGDANSYASYMCFGPCWAVEIFAGTGTYDAHGPGAQRSDPKSVPASWPTSIGDQKDVVQVNNFVRCNRR